MDSFLMAAVHQGIFLEQAELRSRGKKDLTLDYWRASVDKMLTSNEQPLLEGPGAISHDDMKRVAHFAVRCLQ